MEGLKKTKLHPHLGILRPMGRLRKAFHEYRYGFGLLVFFPILLSPILLMLIRPEFGGVVPGEPIVRHRQKHEVLGFLEGIFGSVRTIKGVLQECGADIGIFGKVHLPKRVPEIFSFSSRGGQAPGMPAMGTVRLLQRLSGAGCPEGVDSRMNKSCPPAAFF